MEKQYYLHALRENTKNAYKDFLNFYPNSRYNKYCNVSENLEINHEILSEKKFIKSIEESKSNGTFSASFENTKMGYTKNDEGLKVYRWEGTVRGGKQFINNFINNSDYKVFTNKNDWTYVRKGKQIENIYWYMSRNKKFGVTMYFEFVEKDQYNNFIKSKANKLDFRDNLKISKNCFATTGISTWSYKKTNDKIIGIQYPHKMPKGAANWDSHTNFKLTVHTNKFISLKTLFNVNQNFKVYETTNEKISFFSEIIIIKYYEQLYVYVGDILISIINLHENDLLYGLHPDIDDNIILYSENQTNYSFIKSVKLEEIEFDENIYTQRMSNSSSTIENALYSKVVERYNKPEAQYNINLTNKSDFYDYEIYLRSFPNCKRYNQVNSMYEEAMYRSISKKMNSFFLNIESFLNTGVGGGDIQFEKTAYMIKDYYDIFPKGKNINNVKEIAAFIVAYVNKDKGYYSHLYPNGKYKDKLEKLIETYYDNSQFNKEIIVELASYNSSSSSSSSSSKNITSIPRVKSEGEWKIGEMAFSGKYYYSDIEFKDGTKGRLFKGGTSEEYFIMSNTNKYYQKNKDEALRALYYYKKTDKPWVKSKDLPDWE